MTLKRKRSTSNKVSTKSKQKKVNNGSLFSDVFKSSNRMGIGTHKSGSRMTSKVTNTKDLTSGKNSRSIVSQESVVPPSEEEQVEQKELYFDKVHQRLNHNSDNSFWPTIIVFLMRKKKMSIIKINLILKIVLVTKVKWVVEMRFWMSWRDRKSVV